MRSLITVTLVGVAGLLVGLREEFLHNTPIVAGLALGVRVPREYGLCRKRRR
jgi:hypothetical protein